MHHTDSRPIRPAPAGLPLQAAPVDRTRQAGPDAFGGPGTAGGVAASQDPCHALTGLAQQMCYAAISGIST